MKSILTLALLLPSLASAETCIDSQTGKAFPCSVLPKPPVVSELSCDKLRELRKHGGTARQMEKWKRELRRRCD